VVEADAKPARRKGRKAAAKAAPPATDAIDPAISGDETPPTTPSAVDETPPAPPASVEDEDGDRRLKPQQQLREASQTARGSATPPPVAEVLDLFGEQPKSDDEPFFLPRTDPAELAASLEARFAGSTVAWRDILRAFAATDVTPAELKAALTHLRRGGRASYKAVKGDDDRIDFPTEPIIREKPKRERKPKAADDDVGLFGAAPDPGASDPDA
jgi:hypothetical protein